MREKSRFQVGYIALNFKREMAAQQKNGREMLAVISFASAPFLEK